MNDDRIVATDTIALRTARPDSTTIAILVGDYLTTSLRNLGVEMRGALVDAKFWDEGGGLMYVECMTDDGARYFAIPIDKREEAGTGHAIWDMEILENSE